MRNAKMRKSENTTIQKVKMRRKKNTKTRQIRDENTTHFISPRKCENE